MKSDTVVCAQIRSSFVAGRVPAGPEAASHLQDCPHCRELFENDARLGRSLAQAVLPEVDAGDLFALVERDVSQEIGLRARLRALPTRVRAGALVGVALALALWHLLLLRRPNLGEFSPALFWCIALALGAGLVALALRLAQGPSAPLGSRGRERGLPTLLLFAPALLALLAPLGAGSPAATAWADPSRCFSYGAATVVPLVFLYWLFERRDAVPLSGLVSAGALVGLTANLLLHVHCASANVPHLLLGHASIGVVWALALRLVWGSARAR
jgi:hypothetical protein